MIVAGMLGYQVVGAYTLAAARLRRGNATQQVIATDLMGPGQ
jgi:hypothetical protein